MNTIYKYRMEPNCGGSVEMPKGAQVLSVQMQGGLPCLWAKVDTTRSLERRSFDVYGTGNAMPDDPRLVYVGTFQMDDGALVWHVFESTHAA
jgi:hypothetical protein